MNLKIYLGMLHQAEHTLAASCREVAAGHGTEPDVHFLCHTLAGHGTEPDVHFLCHTLASQCDHHGEPLLPVVQRYGEDTSDNEPERLHAQGLSQTRGGPVGLVRDLRDLYLLASLVDVTWAMVKQAGSALRDQELLDVVAK